jgi:CDP-glucose 4,6-dehydratase
MEGDFGDIRSLDEVARVFSRARPAIVFHLAAQALVREGYSDPLATFNVNLTGTVNVLEQVRTRAPQALVVMTSDKVYAPAGHEQGHLESDRLGPPDPYGASKACCELALEAYARSFFDPAGIASASVRAGNVIGGGDWGQDRLVPDAIRAFSAGQPLSLRRPGAVRPWQHVLDAVAGLLLVAETAAGQSQSVGAWNIGPRPGPPVTVGSLARMLADAWRDGAEVRTDASADFPESAWLAIDSKRARDALFLRTPWTIERAIAETVAWYKHALDGGDAWSKAQQQIAAYDGDRGRGGDAGGRD